MKPAIVFSIPSNTSDGYRWRWRSVDGETDSRSEFGYYYDCLADAISNGYAVRLAVAHGNTSPGWKSLSGK